MLSPRQFITTVLVLCVFSSMADAHQAYMVKPGDTLSQIAAKKLGSSRKWPRIVQANPQLHNPNQLRVGMRLKLPSHHGTMALNLPRDVKYTTIMSRKALDDAPYVVSFEGDHLLGQEGEHAYVRGLNSSTTRYRIYRPQTIYKDPISGKHLGQLMQYIGHGHCIKGGKLATFKIIDSLVEVHINDKLVPITAQAQRPHIHHRHHTGRLQGVILAAIGDGDILGLNQYALLNKGSVDKVHVGDSFSVYHADEAVRDPRKHIPIKVRPPRQKIGELVVVKLFENVSIAVVSHASDPIKLYDEIVLKH